MTPSLPHGRLHFRIRVGEDDVELVLDGRSAEVGGSVVDVDAEPLGGSLWSLLIDGRSVTAHVEVLERSRLRLTFANRSLEADVRDEHDLLVERTGQLRAPRSHDHEIRAPMPGLILSVLVEPGGHVDAGNSLLVIEAMKMENELRAPAAGIVRAVHVAPGEAVARNTLLIELGPPDPEG